MTTLTHKIADLSNRAVLAILLIVAVLASLLSSFANTFLAYDPASAWWVSWLQNISTEMFGAFLTFLLLQIIVGNRQYKGMAGYLMAHCRLLTL